MSLRACCLVCLAATFAAACGGSGGGGDVVDWSQPRVPPVLTPLPGHSFSVPAGGAVRIDFDSPEAGDLLATVDWQDPANNLVAAFTGRGCHSINDALARRCTDAEVGGLPSTCPAKPRSLYTYFYRPVALRLWIANTGETSESGSVALLHCKDAPNCGATLSCAQCTSVMLDRRSCGP